MILIPKIKIIILGVLLFLVIGLSGCDISGLGQAMEGLEQAGEDLEQLSEHVSDSEEISQEPASEKSAGTDQTGEQLPRLKSESQEQTDKAEVNFEPLPAEEGWLDFGNFVKLVQSAQWSGVSPDCYDGTSKTNYDFIATESIDGADADKTKHSFTVDFEESQNWTMWTALDGNIVKVDIEGEDMPDFYELYALLAVPPLGPFALPDPDFNREFKKTLTGENISGWELLGFERSKGNVGGLPAYICEVSFMHQSYGNQPARFIYGDFGTFKLLLEIYLDYASQSTITDYISFR